VARTKFAITVSSLAFASSASPTWTSELQLTNDLGLGADIGYCCTFEGGQLVVI
jgi:hypothetical protein